MNILFIIDSLSGGGAEKVASILSSRMSLFDENKVYIVVDELYGNEYEIDKNVTLISLERKHSRNPGVNIYQKIRKLFKIIDIKTKYAIEFSISMLPIANFYNVLSKRKEMCIVSVRIQMSEEHYPNYIKWMNVVATKYADKLVAVSECVRRDQIRNFGLLQSKSITIYNPCEYDKISRLKGEKVDEEWLLEAKKAGKKVLITHGRLTGQKGQWHLIRVMSELVKKRSDVILLIMGQGELEDYFRKLVCEYGLDNYVFVLGFKKNPYKYLALADAYIFTSLYEGFPNALLDAMAVGLPIISADGVSGIRELLSPSTDCELCATEIELAEYGILIPRFNDIQYKSCEKLDKSESILLKILIQILDDEKMRFFYSQRSKNRIKDFECDYIVKQWLKLLDKIDE